jgi:hypothetical protein
MRTPVKLAWLVPAGACAALAAGCGSSPTYTFRAAQACLEREPSVTVARVPPSALRSDQQGIDVITVTWPQGSIGPPASLVTLFSRSGSVDSTTKDAFLRYAQQELRAPTPPKPNRSGNVWWVWTAPQGPRERRIFDDCLARE